MLSKLSAGLMSIGVLAIGGAVQAATLTIYPDTPGVSGVSGNTTTAAAGFPVGSFQSGPVLDADHKSEIYVTPLQLFGRDITVGELQSMSYFTNKAGNAGAVDWSLNIYTKPSSGTGTNAGSFYESHLVSEPYFTQTSNTDDPSNAWHQWSTAPGANSLRFYDAQRDGGVAGTYTDPTLADLHAGNDPANSGNFEWSNGTSNNYNNETVEYISFQTGSSWSAGFDGLLDGFDISLAGGETAAINFEAAPLPSSAWGGLVLLAGFGALKLRRKNSIA
jgi:hypothetical protein